MANTRSAAKRARQSEVKFQRNQMVRTSARTALKNAIQSLKTDKPDTAKVATQYQEAVRTMTKAASKGALPERRVARKISRLTHLAKKLCPEALDSQKAQKSASAKA